MSRRQRTGCAFLRCRLQPFSSCVSVEFAEDISDMRRRHSDDEASCCLPLPRPADVCCVSERRHKQPWMFSQKVTRHLRP